jgi:hypothetical protein
MQNQWLAKPAIASAALPSQIAVANATGRDGAYSALLSRNVLLVTAAFFLVGTGFFSYPSLYGYLFSKLVVLFGRGTASIIMVALPALIAAALISLLDMRKMRSRLVSARSHSPIPTTRLIGGAK